MPDFVLTPVPVSLVSDLERMIEATLNPNVSHRIADIIGEIQTLNALTNDINAKLKSRTYMGKRETIGNYLIQSAKLFALAESLFNYARRRCDDVSGFDLDSVDIAFAQLELDKPEFNELMAEFARRTAH
jgi:hypothetical protein